MLALKLLLVPAFLLALTFAGRRWGASVGGWLAGLPVVAGPILYILALEQGAAFAASAAVASLSAVFASVAFSVSYANVCLRHDWPVAMLAGTIAWVAAATVLSLLAPSVYGAAVIAMGTLLVCPRAFPAAAVPVTSPVASRRNLLLRAAAGAGLTVAVAFLAPRVGGYWSGLLAVFPVLGIVLATFSHREEGAPFAASLLRGMSTGLYSFAAFCCSLALLLEHLAPTPSFAIASVVALSVQAITKKRLVPRPCPPDASNV